MLAENSGFQLFVSTPVDVPHLSQVGIFIYIYIYICILKIKSVTYNSHGATTANETSATNLQMAA